MAQIDKAWLAEYGITNLTDKQLTLLTNKLRDEWATRVGNKLTDMMTKEQFDEYEAALDKNDEAAQLAVLEKAIPDYSKVVDTELAALGEEIKSIGSKELIKSLDEPQK